MVTKDELREQLLETFSQKPTLEFLFLAETLRDAATFYDEAETFGLLMGYVKRHGGDSWVWKRGVEDYAVHRNGNQPSSAADTFDPFVFTDAHAILSKSVVPRRWLLPGIIADGLSILGGSPKGGKSYLAYALAMAVAKYGKWCNHWDVEQGKVIYVSLEDDENDTHLRLKELDADFTIPAGRMLFVHGAQTMPAFGSGLLEWVEQALDLHKPRLLIIDPISYLYVLKRTGGQFEETKDMLFPLRWLGRQYQCAIVCLDHRRKRSREDVSMVDTLYGSVAKQAVADGLIMVNREDDDIELDLTIRAGKTQKLYLSFVFEDGQCFLTYKGAEEQTASYSDFRTRVIDTVYAASEPLSISDVIAALHLPDTRQTRNNVAQILYRHVKTKEIEKTNRGRYAKGEGR
jgi:hypothetical protein